MSKTNLAKDSASDTFVFPPATRSCPDCGNDGASRISKYSKDGWHISTCDDCGFVYLKNPPDYSALVEEFAWEKTYEAELADRKKRQTKLRKWNHQLRHARVARTQEKRHQKLVDLLGGGKTLDIGCGDGTRLSKPFIPFGIELSKALCAQANAYMEPLGGNCIHAAGAKGIWTYDEGFFNAVVMYSYLEHEIDVHTVLSGAFNALKPGGKTFVRVPNFGSINRRVHGQGWCGFRYPDHVNYFTQASLRSVAQKAGFTFNLVNKANLWVDDNIHAILQKPN